MITSNLISIKGISKKMCEYLNRLRIYDAPGLRCRTMTIEQRKILVGKVNEFMANAPKEQQLTLNQVEMWVRQVEFWRLESISQDTAFMFASAGIRSIFDLAKCDINKLYPVLQSLAGSQLSNHELESKDKVNGYIEEAKRLAGSSVRSVSSDLFNIGNYLKLDRKIDASTVNTFMQLGIFTAADLVENYTPNTITSEYHIFKRIYQKLYTTTPPAPNHLVQYCQAAKEYLNNMTNAEGYSVAKAKDMTLLAAEDENCIEEWGYSPEYLFTFKSSYSATPTDNNYNIIKQGLEELVIDECAPLPSVIKGTVLYDDGIGGSPNNGYKPERDVLVELEGLMVPVVDVAQSMVNPTCVTLENGEFTLVLPEQYNLKTTVTFIFNLYGETHKISYNASQLLANVSASSKGGDELTVVMPEPFRLNACTVCSRNQLDKGEGALPSVKLMGNDEKSVHLTSDTLPERIFSYSMVCRMTNPDVKNERDYDSESDESNLARMKMRSAINISKYRDSGLNIASELGFGYVLNMQQVWIPDGYALGDMLYSLVLAPGEEQRIIVNESTDQYTVEDEGNATDRITDTYSQSQGDYASATFRGAISQMSTADSASSYRSKSSSGSAGAFLGLFGGTHSSASSSGSSSAHASQRDSYNNASNAAQRFQTNIKSSAERVSSTHKQAVRAAKSNEQDAVSSKIVANHNHSHVMTVQYWEIMRRYKIESCINDVNLVLFVPFSLIDFGQSTDLKSGTASDKVKKLKDSWKNVVRYYDILYPELPYQYRRGLNLCRKYYNMESFQLQETNSESTVVSVKVQGNFTSFDDIKVQDVKMIMKDGRSFRPSGIVSKVYTMPLFKQGLLPSTREQIISELKLEFHNSRSSEGNYFDFIFVIPENYIDSDVLRIDINRSCFGYQETAPQEYVDKALEGLGKELGYMTANNRDTKTEITNAKHYRNTIDGLTTQVSPREIMQISDLQITGVSQEGWQSGITTTLGTVTDSYISINVSSNKTYLRCDELREINIALEHIRDNRVDYSRLVWGSLSTTELALILDNYTIESDDIKSEDGKANAGKDIPLLNCIDVMSPIGFYGNSLMFPFCMPKQLAEQIGKTSKEIQNNLYKYHANAFRVPSTSISLPTKGMVGEATLGETNVSEKIDLTRFWNWKDSDIDHLDISSDYMSKNSILTSDNANTMDISAATQGVAPTAHISTPDLVSALLSRQDPAFKDLSKLVDMGDILKEADKNNAAGRDKALDALNQGNAKVLDTVTSLASGAITGKANQGVIDKIAQVSNGNSDVLTAGLQAFFGAKGGSSAPSAGAGKTDAKKDPNPTGGENAGADKNKDNKDKNKEKDTPKPEADKAKA